MSAPSTPETPHPPSAPSPLCGGEKGAGEVRPSERPSPRLRGVINRDPSPRLRGEGGRRPGEGHPLSLERTPHPPSAPSPLCGGEKGVNLRPGERLTPSSILLDRYDVPVPRYTSYPTVPYWCNDPTPEQWLEELRAAAANHDATWAIYIHVPFCESLCTFCGCNNVITQNHEREAPYVETVAAEWAKYLEAVPDLRERPLRQLHLGGGTPTFLSPASLKELLEPMLDSVNVRSGEFDASIEINPRVTSVEHLRVLRELGFTRVSMGVQDFDATVQHLVNRVQPFAITEDLTRAARDLGYTSINYDLIYGLPKQTPESMFETARLTATLRPERIALYSFAKVPWIKPAQRLFKDDDLPEGPDKRRLYEIARDVFIEAGYVEIGMDHFALPDDPLTRSRETGELHRNFMGYTEFRTDILLGLG